jgi:hypothetical protein
MKLFWKSVAVALTMVASPSFAADSVPAAPMAQDETPIPAPPMFSIKGIDAYANDYQKASSNNVLDAYIGKNNFWRKLAFGMDGDENKLRIVYWCTAADTQRAALSEGPYTRSNLCPDVWPTTRSRGVQRIKFGLSGTDSSNYFIEYECWIGCANQPVQNPGGQHQAGEWCGVMPPNPAVDCWVGRIAVTIRAK